MCMPSPSPTKEMPISSKNDSARTFTVGWRLTKALMGPAANIITPTDRITAASMMGISLAIPTAVMTESSEKMISNAAICAMTAANDGRTRAELRPSSPSKRS